MRLLIPSLILLSACAPDGNPLGLDVGPKINLSQVIAGDLLINEVMQNPSAVTDYRGEWFEIINNSSNPIDIDGLVVEDTSGASFTVSGSYTINPGEYFVFTRNADTTVNGGVTGDYSWPSSSFALGNGYDDISLTYSGLYIDSVLWDNSVTFPDPNGASMNLDATGLSETGNDSGANWCDAVSTYGDGDLGTPGSINDDCGLTGGLAALSVGDLVVTEVFQNPAAVSDFLGEWFEILNASSGDVDLLGLEVSDNSGATFTVDSSVLVPAGGYAVLVRNGDTTVNGGVTGDFVWPSGNYALGNGSDEIILGYGGTTFDTVTWDNGATFPDPNGASMTLSSSTLNASDNDDSAYWCEAVATFGDGDLGTPGSVNSDCGITSGVVTVGALIEGELVVTEVMQNPSAVTDYRGEWFEIYNAANAAVDLDGLVVSDDAGASFTVNSSVVVAAGAYAVLTRSSVSTTNGGVTSDFAWPSSSFALGNGSDQIILSHGTTIFDEVAWDNGSTFPDPNGAAMNLDFTILDDIDNDNGANWCEAQAAYGDGDLGTPGAANTSCNLATALDVADLFVGDLVVTEVMQNPAAVTDYRGEWFEIYNTSGFEVDLDGLRVSDDSGASFTVSGTVLVQASSYAVLTRNSDSSVNGGVTGDYSWPASNFALGNGSDEIILSYGTTVFDDIGWDNGASFPDPSGSSISLDPSILNDIDNDAGANWCESSSSFGDGDLGTPGVANDVCN